VTWEFATCWERLNEKGRWEHNHVEYDWAEGDTPKAVNSLQERSWTNAKWRKTTGYLIPWTFHLVDTFNKKMDVLQVPRFLSFRDAFKHLSGEIV